MKRYQMNSKYKRKVKLRKWFNQMGTCPYCGSLLSAPHNDYQTVLEHVVPWSKGGRNAVKNLVLACRDCDTRKGTEVWEPTYLPEKECA